LYHPILEMGCLYFQSTKWKYVSENLNLRGLSEEKLKIEQVTNEPIHGTNQNHNRIDQLNMEILYNS